MVKVKKDLTGQQFGRLTVLRQVEDYVSPKGKFEARWECQCECGNTTTVTGHCLKSNRTKSCGCLSEENRKLNGHKNKKYNKYDSTIHEDEYGKYMIGYPSNTNEPFYFDVEDYELIKNYCWSEDIDKRSKYHRLRAFDMSEHKIISFHQLLGCKNYDHIDHNPFNNRRCNLRKCSHQENSFNCSIPKNNTSGIIGLNYRKKRNIWEVYIHVNYKSIFLGSFHNKDDAIVARLQAEKEYYKEFAPQQHLFEQYNIK